MKLMTRMEKKTAYLKDLEDQVIAFILFHIELFI